MAKPLVLVVDDDLAILRMIGVLLGGKNYRVVTASDAYHAIEEVRKAVPDVMLVDWMMPGLSGLDLVKRLRTENSTRCIPIIMLTAKAEEESVVSGLQAGADDYITKPFSGQELMARIDALLRRTQTDTTATGNVRVVAGAMVLDPSEHRVSIAGCEVVVGPTEFKMLHFFMENPNKVFSRVQILDKVWGVNACVEERTVDVQIRRLRKSLESHGYDKAIKTVHGIGYCLSVSGDGDHGERGSGVPDTGVSP